MYWCIDNDVPTDDAVVQTCRRIRDRLLWALLAVIVLLTFANLFTPLGVVGAVVFVIAVFAAMAASMVALVLPWLRPRRSAS